MTKRVVFAGGVQVKALAKAYRLDVALDYDEDVFFIGAESIAREPARRVVAAADILVTDITADGPTVGDELIQVGTLRIAVPVVIADFIWPYAAGAHPRNGFTPGLPDGPYPAGFGDSVLDRLADEGVSEAEAIERYLALDVAQDAALSEKFSATMAALRQLDKRTGFDLAAFIEGNFRKQLLFATRDRPNLPLFKHIAARLFGQMGVAPSRITQLSDTFFPPGMMPIHPAVLKHFSIEEPAADYRYPVLDEGYFSFESYCRRYWNFEFNRLLHSAIAKAETNPTEAIPELRLALEKSPESRAGLRALKDAERAVSDKYMLTPLALPAPPAPAAANAVPEPVAATPVVAAPVIAAPVVAAPVEAAPAEAAPVVPEPAVAEPVVRAAIEPVLAEAAPAETAPNLAAGEPVAEPGEPKLFEVPLEEQPPQPSPALSFATATAIIPRSAFGSSLVRVPPAARSLDPIDTEAEEAALPSLRFSPLPAKADDAKPASAGALVPLTAFSETDRITPLVLLPAENEPEPEPQPYVELPNFGDPPALPAPANALSVRGRSFTPLAPAEHLIPLLPRMLPNSRGMAGAVDKSFIDMPETMPPPPLRPVLPPELHPETVKVSLMSKIMDQLRK
jgi:hypothetical protein